MNEKDYKARKDLLEEEYQNKRISLAKRYAILNNPYAIGDKFTDHIGTIIIRSWKIDVFPLGGGVPMCVYQGDNLTKTGSINKKDPVRTAWQSNEIKK